MLVKAPFRFEIQQVDGTGRLLKVQNGRAVKYRGGVKPHLRAVLYNLQGQAVTLWRKVL